MSLASPHPYVGEHMAEDDLPVIEFVAPVPGFPDRRRFVLVRLDDQAPVYALRSLEDPELRFLVLPPLPFFPDYAPEIDEQTLDLLGTRDIERILILLVVTAGDSAAEATANLLAPILVDRDTMRAVQAILGNSGLGLAAPLVPARAGTAAA